MVLGFFSVSATKCKVLPGCSARANTGFRASPHTKLCLFESHWGHFLGNVSFIHNSVSSQSLLSIEAVL